MGLTKSKGNMYPWVTHTHSHLAGQCPHLCGYCFVQAMGKRFPNMKARYSGKVRLMEDELAVDYGNGKTIFIEHMNDLFANDVDTEMIERIMVHCLVFPDNTYVFQTKNPRRMFEWWWMDTMPSKLIFGTTIESDIFYPAIMKQAPQPIARMEGFSKFLKGGKTLQRFVTIEPILDFNPETLAHWILQMQPNWVNIGADSKQSHLPEPEWGKVKYLIDAIQSFGIEIRQKSNLERLKNHD